MRDKNLANSAVKVFSVYKKLLSSNVRKTDLLSDFSEDSLLVYLNTLKHLGILISYPKRSCLFYSMKNNFDFLNLTSQDIRLFSDIKKLLSENSTYLDIINFNNFLVGLTKYVSIDCAGELNKIISQLPFGVSLHEKLFLLQKFIEDKQAILVEYNSPNSTLNYFKILPKSLNLRKGKMYLWGADNLLGELRCIRVDRINSISEIEETIINVEKKFAVCKFSLEAKKNLLSTENIEILSEDIGGIVCKYSFYNDFMAIQELLNYGLSCEVLEPEYLRDEIKEKIFKIGELYG